MKLDELPASTRRWKRRSPVRMSESGGRAVERKLTLPVTPDAPMIGIKPMFSGRSLADGANAEFDIVMAAPDGKTLARPALRYDLLKVETSYQCTGKTGNGNTSRSSAPSALRTAPSMDRRQAGAAVAAGEMGPLSPGSLDR